MVPITHEQNIICTKTRLDVTTHEQTIICRQLFAGHMVGSQPMERKEKNASNDNYMYHTMKPSTISELAGYFCIAKQKSVIRFNTSIN